MATLGMEALTTEGYTKRPAEHFIEGWQTVGLNALYVQANGRLQRWTTGAYGHRAGWPRGALCYSGKRPAEDFKRFRGLNSMCRQLQVATLEQQGLTATGLGGSCREASLAWTP